MNTLHSSNIFLKIFYHLEWTIRVVYVLTLMYTWTECMHRLLYMYPHRSKQKLVAVAFVEKKSHSRRINKTVCARWGGQKLMKRQAVAYWKRFNERTECVRERRLFILLFPASNEIGWMMKNIGTWHRASHKHHQPNADTYTGAQRPIDADSACERKCEIRFRKD